MHPFIRSFDRRVTKLIQSWPAWFRTPMVAITNVGQPLTVVLFTIGLMIWAWLHDRQPLLNATIVVLVTIIVATILKFILHRARPINEYVRRMWFRSFSFPSEHATAATVGFGFFAYLVVITVVQPWNLIIALSVAIFACLVGVSRIYLGAHYPTDVAGGVVIGVAGLIIAILVHG